ncbi:Outer membrane protein TolC [Cyclobacterium lianum]|uniref:Outer membrane protein TolC n=1 Tax=Cyclobacterium lianum TaxID=388280 RepID=A0A1M7P7N6_9BACT|nr:Outer membrane protein TolC [Cyclobacterium lianum]
MLNGYWFTTTEAQEIPFTLEESVTYALENNADARNARLEIEAARGLVGERRAEGLPQINTSVSATKNLIVPISPFPAMFFDPDAPEGEFIGVQFSPEYSAGLTATVSQMIFNGSYFIGLQAAKTYKQLAEVDREFTELEVIENVKKAYYSVLVSEERETLVRANLGRIDTLLRETQILFDEGFVEKIDVTRIRVQRNNIQTELDKASTAKTVSLRLLKLQMGMPEDQDIQLVDEITALESLLDADRLLMEEGQPRVEVEQINTNYELATLDLKNNQIQYMPRLDANYTFQRNAFGGSFSNLWSGDWFTGSILGVTLQIPIFDGLTKKYKIQQNRVQLRQLEVQKEFTLQNIALEKFQARQNLTNSLKALDVQRENRDMAMEVFDMAKIKYQEGVGSNLEVVEADTALKEAETNYFSALYDAFIAKVDLEKALGILK